MTIIKMCAEAVLFAIIIGIVVGAIGYMNQWDTSRAYSDAFFIAGCLLIITGGMSRLLAGQEWVRYQLFSSESLRNMNSSDQANYIINASSSFKLVILGVLSGILLIIVSAILTKPF